MFGINDKNEIQAAKYAENLDSIKEIRRPVNDQVGSLFGMPFIATFCQRNVFDLRIVYKSGVVAWLTLDKDLNEIGYKEYKYSKRDSETTEKGIFNPIYSIPSYASNFISPTPFNGCFVGEYYYQFLTSGSAEFSNTISDKYTYYNGVPVIRKMKLIENTGPFYKELKRIPASEAGIGYFSPADYHIQFMKRENGLLCFLAKNADGNGEAMIISIDEQTLRITNKIKLTPNSTGLQLGQLLDVTTVYDSINQRIIQAGNCTGNAPGHYSEFVGQESFFISEYNLQGIVTHFRKIPYPDYNLYTKLNSRKFHQDFKRFIVEEKGIRIFKDGSIKLVGKNDMLTTFKYSQGRTATGADITKKEYYYSTILVSFLNIDKTFEMIESKSIAKKLTHKNHKYQLYDALEDFMPGTSINDATGLFVSRTADMNAFGLNQQGQNTTEHSVFSSYYGMKSLKAGIFKSVFILNAENCLLFDKSKGGKFSLNYVPNHK